MILLRNLIPVGMMRTQLNSWITTTILNRGVWGGPQLDLIMRISDGWLKKFQYGYMIIMSILDLEPKVIQFGEKRKQ